MANYLQLLLCLLVLHYVIEKCVAITENTTKWRVVLLTAGRPLARLGALRAALAVCDRTLTAVLRSRLFAVFKMRLNNHSADS